MTVYEMKPDRIEKLDETSFERAGIKERTDLQRLLRNQIDVISPDTLVISEEFGEWKIPGEGLICLVWIKRPTW